VVGARVLCHVPEGVSPMTEMVWLPSKRPESVIGVATGVEALYGTGVKLVFVIDDVSAGNGDVGRGTGGVYTICGGSVGEGGVRIGGVEGEGTSIVCGADIEKGVFELHIDGLGAVTVGAAGTGVDVEGGDWSCVCCPG